MFCLLRFSVFFVIFIYICNAWDGIYTKVRTGVREIGRRSVAPAVCASGVLLSSIMPVLADSYPLPILNNKFKNNEVNTLAEESLKTPSLLMVEANPLASGLQRDEQATRDEKDMKMESDLVSETKKSPAQAKKEEIVLDDVKNGVDRPFKEGIKTGIQLNPSRARVLTLSAYLEEVERLVAAKDWAKLNVYLYTFADQEESFAELMDGLFPYLDPLDESARQALTFDAQQVFLNLEDLREAASNAQEQAATKAYAQLALFYDRFLKAGDLYPTYDPITSTEIFYRGTKTPDNTLRWDTKGIPRLRDRVLFTRGPDMGKTGIVLDISYEARDQRAIVKLDKDGREYQEVKECALDNIAKTLQEDDDVPYVNRRRAKQRS